MPGIHINKKPAIWRSFNNKLNMIVADRVDALMPIFKMKNNNDSSQTDDVIATVQGSQYNSSNTAVTTVDSTNFINSGNVIFWYNNASTTHFDRNNFFPVLYESKEITITNEGEENETRTDNVLLKPIYFSMYPEVHYDISSDKVSLLFWSNVKTYADGPQEKFSYQSFGVTTKVDFEIVSVIASNDITVSSTSSFKRALFATEGKKVKAFFDIKLNIDGQIANTNGAFLFKEVYIFTTPKLIYLPTDAEANVVVDIGAGGGGNTQFVELSLDF